MEHSGSLRLWNLKPLYQYCWLWRGMKESRRWSMILVVNGERMVRREYRNLLAKRSGLKV
jgi:hypothetical protein